MKLTKDILRKICRYEVRYADLIKDDEPVEEEEIYEFTIEDLHKALYQCSLVGDPEVFLFDWFKPVTELANDHEIIELPLLNEPDGWDDHGLPDAYNVFQYVWRYLFEMNIAEIDADHLLRIVSYYFENRGLPVYEWKLDDIQMEYFLDYWEERYALADRPTVGLYRKYLEELCRKNNADALRRKAYACYGDGNGYYRQDWHMSMQCLEKWFELTGSSRAANSLGYMYYYGRTNHGKPQYDKAFYYFSIGAADGFYESRYKLSDMFLHGYGVPKNEHIAASLIWELYPEMYGQMKRGYVQTNMADVALRAGNICRDGIDRKKDDYAAYFYYLQAQYAIRRRMEDDPSYGDSSVASRIRQCIAELKPKIDGMKEKPVISPGLLIGGVLNGTNRIQMKIADADDGRLLTFTVLPRYADEEPDRFAVTVPHMHYCNVLRSLTVKVKDITRFSLFHKDSDTVVFDEINGNNFYLYGEWAACIAGTFEPDLAD